MCRPTLEKSFPLRNPRLRGDLQSVHFISWRNRLTPTGGTKFAQGVVLSGNALQIQKQMAFTCAYCFGAVRKRAGLFAMFLNRFTNPPASEYQVMRQDCSSRFHQGFARHVELAAKAFAKKSRGFHLLASRPIAIAESG